jgi:ankyrin repeat protein
MSLETEPNTSGTVDALSAAKIVRLVVDDDVTGLSQYLLALVRENDGIKRPRYYLGSVLNELDCNGWCPLHHAFHLRRYECAKLLIDAGET